MKRQLPLPNVHLGFLDLGGDAREGRGDAEGDDGRGEQQRGEARPAVSHSGILCLVVVLRLLLLGRELEMGRG